MDITMTDVEIGQKYRQVDLPHDLWEVVTIIAHPGEVPHARLHRVGVFKDLKTISFSALADKKLFQLVR